MATHGQPLQGAAGHCPNQTMRQPVRRARSC